MDISDQMECVKNVGFDPFFTMWHPERTEELSKKAARLGLTSNPYTHPSAAIIRSVTFGTAARR